MWTSVWNAQDAAQQGNFLNGKAGCPLLPFLFASLLACVDAGWSRPAHWTNPIFFFPPPPARGGGIMLLEGLLLFLCTYQTNSLHRWIKSWATTMLGLLEGRSKGQGTDILLLALRKMWLNPQLQSCLWWRYWFVNTCTSNFSKDSNIILNMPAGFCT